MISKKKATEKLKIRYLSSSKFCSSLFLEGHCTCHRHYQSLSVLLVSVSNSNQYSYGTKTKISTSFFFFLEWDGTQPMDTRQKKQWGEKKTRAKCLGEHKKKKSFLDLHLKTKEVLENKLLVAWIDKLKKKQQ